MGDAMPALKKSLSDLGVGGGGGGGLQNFFLSSEKKMVCQFSRYGVGV